MVAPESTLSVSENTSVRAGLARKAVASGRVPCSASSYGTTTAVAMSGSSESTPSSIFSRFGFALSAFSYAGAK